MTLPILSCTLFLMIGATPTIQAQQTPALRFEAYEFEVEGVGKVSAELGRLTLPEDRTAAGGREIEIAFARLKSTNPKPGSPIVYLDGGPGGSGVGIARIPAYYALFDQLRAVGDVILLSQRGTGLSKPRLACASTGLPPANVLQSAAAMTAGLAERTRACAQEWNAKGANLQAYNTEASADDLEDLRKALGASKLSLLGFSYGTHLALAAARRHPGSLDRLILAGTEGPDHTQKLPSTFDQQLARIAALEAAESKAPTPGLIEVTDALLDRLKTNPVTVSIEAPGLKAPIPVTIGREGFQFLVRLDIGDTNDTAAVVRMIRETAAGEFGTLKRFAARRLGQMAGGTTLMGTAMDCASGVSPERAARIEREISTGVLGVMTNYPFPQICELVAVKPLPESYRAPLVSHIPALFISGTLDSNTPPFQAEEVRWGFPNSTHLIVENAGHESTLPNPEVQRAIVDFLKGQDVSGRRVALRSPLAK